MSHETELWNAFLKAREQQHTLYDAQGKFGYFEYDESIFEYPISEGLRSLLKRAQILSDDIRAFENEIEHFYQKAAWEYAQIAFDLNKGDQIEIMLGEKIWIIYCETLYSNSLEQYEFTVSGSIAKKDGSPGKRWDSIPLALADWKIVGRARNTAEQGAAANP